MKAKDVMIRNVITVKQDITMRDLTCFLAEKKLHGVPVLNSGGRMVGIITENDIIFEDRDVQISFVSYLLHSVMKLMFPVDQERERFLTGGAPTKENFEKTMDTVIREKMSKDLVIVSPETSIEEMSEIMSTKKIHLLPVEEDGELVGIVGKGDILKGIASSVKRV